MSSQQLKRISQFVPPGSTIGRKHGSKNKRLQVISQAELAQQFVSSGLLVAPAQVGGIGAPVAAPIFVPADGLDILTSGVPAVVCSFPLAAGSWDISGSMTFNPNGAASVSFTDAIVAINTSPVIPTGIGPHGGGYAEMTSSMSTSGPTTIATAVMRLVLVAPATVYLLAQATFS